MTEEVSNIIPRFVKCKQVLCNCLTTCIRNTTYFWEYEEDIINVLYTCFVYDSGQLYER